MVQIPSQLLTLDEFLKLPETKPASEFIDFNLLVEKRQDAAQGDFSELSVEQIIVGDVDQFWKQLAKVSN